VGAAGVSVAAGAEVVSDVVVAGVEAAGAVVAAVVGGAGVPPTTELVSARWPQIASAPTMNSTASTLVALVSTVTPPRRKRA